MSAPTKLDKLRQNVGPRVDRTVAHGLAGLSAGARYYQRPHDWFMAADAPSYVPVTWKVSGDPAKSIVDWADFPGDPKSGRIPRNYRSAGIVAINRAALDELQEQEGGVHAAAYSIGSVVVVGALPDGFGLEDSNDERYVVGMRIGRGKLSMTAGLWVEDKKRIQVPTRALCIAGSAAVANFPENIPLL